MEGLRVIDDSKGKKSLSKFKLLKYDAIKNESILICSPKTGRSHQLRVHLQSLGFPIIGDALYGGGKGCEGLNTVDFKVVESGMTKKKRKTLVDEAAELKAADDEKAVSDLCDCCIHGVKESFKDSQLLQHGSMICLHALKYQIRFLKKGEKGRKAKKRKLEEEGGVVGAETTENVDDFVVMDFITKVPAWVEEVEVSSLSFI